MAVKTMYDYKNLLVNTADDGVTTVTVNPRNLECPGHADPGRNEGLLRETGHGS